MSKRLGQLTAVCSGGLCLTSIILYGGCSSPFDTIDFRSAELARDTTFATGSTVSPDRRFGDSSADEAAYLKQPSTANPAAGELVFEPTTNADVQANLLGYARKAAGVGSDQEPIVLDLAGALAMSQTGGPDYLEQEETYLLSAISLLAERHRWGPRLFNDTSLDVSGGADDGEIESALSAINTLRVTRRLTYGGEVEARWVTRASENLRSSATGRYRQSSEIALDATIPLMRGSGLVARESIIQAERDLVYAARAFERFRRQYLVDIASDYLSLLESLSRISNQKTRLESLRLQLKGDQLRMESGRISAFQVNITRNEVLGAIASLAAARESFIPQLERFKVRLGIDPSTPVVLERTIFDLSDPVIDLDRAALLASEYRLDWQNRRDALDDDARSVVIAKDQLRPDLSLSGEIGIPTDPDVREGGLVFDPDDFSYRVGANLSLPLDREIEALGVRSAQIRYERAQRDTRQFHDNLMIEARSSARQIDLSRFQLTLAERRVEINEQRKKEQELKSDRVTAQERVDTENALLDALNERDSAQTRLRIAILQYLLATGQMRVGRTGSLEPLDGMDVLRVTIFENVKDLQDWYLDPVTDGDIESEGTPSVPAPEGDAQPENTRPPGTP